jgi:hypothetical protein
VPLPEFKANLEAMIKKLKSKGIRNIVIMTPPPVVDRMVRKADGSLAPTPTQADMKQYSAAAVAVASQQGMPSVDVFNIIQKFKNWQVCVAQLMQLAANCDWLHVQQSFTATHLDLNAVRSCYRLDSIHLYSRLTLLAPSFK